MGTNDTLVTVVVFAPTAQIKLVIFNFFTIIFTVMQR